MIVLGDYAAIHGIDSRGLRESFADEAVVLNLEGAITEKNSDRLRKKQVVFNVTDVIPFLKSLNVKAVTLANNHFYDIGDSSGHCQELLARESIAAVGAGDSVGQARLPAVIDDHGTTYVLCPFCWSVTNGRPARINRRGGVNPLTKDNVERCIREAKAQYPGAKIILVMHWGIELEKYPEPMHIRLAHYALDHGADMIIGHHPHIIQPVEVYKGKYIFYSIGNFYIEEDVYFNGRLRYPRLAREALAVELKGDSVSALKLVRNDQGVSVSKKMDMEDVVREYGFPAREETYDVWFKKHRVKSKLIPIWYDPDALASNKMKDAFCALRNAAVQILFALHLKKGRKRE